MGSTIVNTVLLSDEKLRLLAGLIRGHEVQNMYHITFASLGEQFQYLRMVNDNLASVYTILDDVNAVVARYSADPVRTPIASLIRIYVEHSLNNALQLFPNYTLRRDYLDKMLEHHTALYEALEDLNTSSQDDAVEMTAAIQELDDVVIRYMRLSLNPHASAEFSRYLNNIGISFQDLVTGHQRQLGYTGMFENLEIEQKLDVYASILERSGRMSILSTFDADVIDKAADDDGDAAAVKSAAAGEWDMDVTVKASAALYSSRKRPGLGSSAMFLLDMGTIVWDVYSADHTMTAALREGLIFAAEAGGAALGKLVGVAAATGMTGMAATSLFVTAVGLAAGFVGAFILGAVAGMLFSLIFGSGGQATLPTDGFVVYVAPMPNGHNLARQIA